MNFTNRSNTFKITALVVGALALLVGWRFYVILFGGGGGRQEGRARGISNKVAVDITRMDKLEFSYEFVGNVESVQTADIVARTSGLLEEVTKLSGDEVNKGELLAKIDDAQPLANFYKVKSDLANARFTYYQLLSQQELTDVQADSGVAIAQANLSAAQAGVRKSESVFQATLTQGQSSVAQAEATRAGAESLLRQAEVAFNQTEVQYERMLGLQRQGFVSAADVQDAYAEVLSAHAVVQARKSELRAAETRVLNAREQAKKDNVSAEADIQTTRFTAESARASVAEARAGTSRSESFQQQLRAQQSLVEAAEAELQSAQLQVKDTTLESPVDGFVSERHLDPGTLVNVGDVILTVQAGGEVWVVASLPQEIYNYVSKGTSCKVKIDGLRDRLFEAFIFSKDSSISEVSRQFSIRVKIDDPDRLVKPGMFARVLLTLGPQGERLVVPTSALYNRNDEARTATVYQVLDGKVRVVDLELGPGDDQKTIVVSGLKSGDQVVVQTANPLAEGQEVDAVRVDSTEVIGRPTGSLSATPTPGASE
ncbi:MAG: efflux RND transporter periplasmic adaptor subunit [Vulcanimicrobiota bacterium]